MTRKSGFSVHEDTTGGEFRRISVPSYKLKKDEQVAITFHMRGHAEGDLLGYGVWLWYSSDILLSVNGGPEKRTLTEYSQESWNKSGSIWKAQNAEPVDVTVLLTATGEGEVAVYEPLCGRIRHPYLDNARAALLKNMFEFAPEALFPDGEIAAEVERSVPENAPVASHELIVKSCNRCGRFLPINEPMERDHLSFTNHCVAYHRRPCAHSTFGRLRNVDAAEDILRLDYGFQLECRFCKKFEVNAAHNPQRTSAQMKEDGARRRALELLLGTLYKGTPQLRFRSQAGQELTDYIWEKFGHSCFNCGTNLATPNLMHLDHTRPLALLWPLDGTATALCESCNNKKRDRTPGDFYTLDKLEQLSGITELSLENLKSKKPNEEAIDLLLSRLDWFFDVFLGRDEMTKERDGKIAGELVVKALQKVLARSPRHRHVNLQQAYAERRAVIP